MMKHIEVVAAIIQELKEHEGDKIFATQRGYGDYKGWWEFPGDLEVEKIYENAPNDQTEESIRKRCQYPAGYWDYNLSNTMNRFLTADLICL